MATQTSVQPKVKGGSFLIEERRPEEIFTPEDFTDEHRQIAQTTDEYFHNEVLPHLEQIEHKDFALLRQLLQKAGELGLLSIDIPEKYGGMELDKVSSMIVAEHISKNGSFAGSFGAHAGIGTNPIIFFGTEAQKACYLPRLARAELLSAYALSEAHAGSDALAARTRADLTPDGKHYLLNGEKMWITNGGFADLYIVFAKVGGEKFTAFIVEKAFGGVTPGPEEKKMGINGSSTTPLILTDCKVPPENVLYEVGRGHVVAFNILNMGRLKLGAACAGGCKMLLQQSAKYAKERKAFGKSIAEFGLIQHKLAEMAVKTFALEGILYRTTGMIDALYAESDHEAPESARKAIEEYAVECAINKVYGSEALDYVADEAVQIYGGYGYHRDYPPERAYRDARINRIFEGTNEINRLLTTGMLMKRAMSGHLPLIPAAQRLLAEVLSGPAAADDVVGNIKKIALFAAGVAFQKYMQALADQQEVVAGISNIIMEAYVAETAQLRTRKMKGREQAKDMAAVLIYDALNRAEAEARTVLAACAEGDTLRANLAVLRRFAKQEPLDTITLRRRIAQRVLDAEKYVV